MSFNVLEENKIISPGTWFLQQAVTGWKYAYNNWCFSIIVLLYTQMKSTVTPDQNDASFPDESTGTLLYGKRSSAFRGRDLSLKFL